MDTQGRATCISIKKERSWKMKGEHIVIIIIVLIMFIIGFSRDTNDSITSDIPEYVRIDTVYVPIGLTYDKHMIEISETICNQVNPALSTYQCQINFHVDVSSDHNAIIFYVQSNSLKVPFKRNDR